MPKVSAARPTPRTPKLGQHFLIDTSAAERIADAFGDLSQSTVLEIGAGRGALTSLLARRTRRLRLGSRDCLAAVRAKLQKDGAIGRIAGHIRTEKTLNFLFEQSRKEAGKPEAVADSPKE